MCHADFDDIYGVNRSTVCAIGFEPNPNHAKLLSSMEMRHARHNRFVQIYNGYASTRNGIGTIFMNDRYIGGKTHNSWTAGRSSKHSKNVNMTTKEFNVSQILLSLPSGGIIAMKMDIEGSAVCCPS